MDLGSVIGLVLILGLLFGAMAMGVGVGAYIDIPSVLIVIGGSIGALLVAFKMEQMKNFVKIFMIAIKPPQENVAELIKKLVEYSTQARRDGILSLEAAANNEENEFLKKGLSMAVDGNEPDTIRELLEIEMEQTSERHKANAAIFDQWRDADENLVKTIILEGIMSIQAGDNPRTLEAKLLSFLPPNERVSQFE